jgi:tRNA-Thr(GGU) m(6)t(6)A37 methyltransferase TsaA
MNKLYIDPEGGIAGDMFASALISLGAPEKIIIANMEKAASYVGNAKIQVKKKEDALSLEIAFHSRESHLKGCDAREYLQQIYEQLGIKPLYRIFGNHLLDILIEAEREAHSKHHFFNDHFHVSPIGTAHSPYTHQAPFRPDPDASDEFYVDVFPEYQAGLKDLEQFSHAMLIAYLDRSKGYSMLVSPPWIDSQVGLFASRSPFRPNPVGVDIVEIKAIKQNRIYTGPTDFLNNTPILDIKPVIRDLDHVDKANNGWLKNSGMQQKGMDKEGMSHGHHGHLHHHSSDDALLHEAQDILIDITGCVTGLQLLDIEPEAIITNPVSVGNGTVNFSHGKLPVPAPATDIILKKYNIPWKYGPVNTELCTPTGAAILAALKATEGKEPGESIKKGYARGTKKLDIPPLCVGIIS